MNKKFIGLVVILALSVLGLASVLPHVHHVESGTSHEKAHDCVSCYLNANFSSDTPNLQIACSPLVFCALHEVFRSEVFSPAQLFQAPLQRAPPLFS